MKQHNRFSALVNAFLLFALYGLSAAGILWTHINHNVAVYFAPHNPAYMLDQKAKEFFPEDEFFILLFEGDDLFEDSFLKPFTRAINKIQKVDHLDRVLSIVTNDHLEGTADGFETSPLFDPYEDFDLTPEQRKERVLGDRFAHRTIISPDGKSMTLVLRPQKNTSTTQQVQMRGAAMDILEEEKLMPYLAGISGPGEIIYAQLQAMFDSLKIFVPLATMLNILLLAWLFPRLLVIGLSVIVMGIAIQSPIVALNLMGRDFTMIHTMIPSLMAALSVALLVHYFNKIKFYSRKGYSASDRAIKARGDVYKPALFAALTTATGLGSLGLSPIPPIQTFGIVSALGVLLIFIVIMYILPPILGRWDHDRPWKQGHNLDMFLARFTMACGRFSIRRAPWVLALTCAGLLAGAPFLAQVKVETNVFKFFAEDHAINVDTDKIESALAGVTPLEILISSETLDFLKSPESLHYIRQLQAWLETRPEIDLTDSHAELVEEMHWAFNEENDAFRKVPENAKLISQYIFIYDAADLYEFVNYDFNVARINISMNIHEVGRIDTLTKSIKDYIAKNPLPGAQIEVTGFGTLYTDLSTLVVKTQLYSLLVALGVIFIFMIIIFRSLSSGLLCMVPNLSPVVIIFMLMGIFSIWLDIGTAMIASVGVGIAVDDTIHLYHAYIRRRRAGHGTVFSLMRAYQHEGRAISTTTLVLVSQFMVIFLSDFLPASHFGLLSAVGVFTALVFDLFVLPAILVMLMKIKRA